MIELYLANNTNYDNNGNITLTPIDCKIDIKMNDAWQLTLVHPLDDQRRYMLVEEGAVLKVNSFNGKQLFRIDKVEKSESQIQAYASPIFLDALNDCFLLDVRPTMVNGQTALNKILAPNSKYKGSSDIIKMATAYYVNKNAVEAINGNDENAFTQRWGGQIVYDNFRIVINNRAGDDYGVYIKYGRNLLGVKETISRDSVITRIIPKAYNGYMLDGNKPWVDSPIINSYPIVYTKVVEFDDVKMQEDAGEDEVGFTKLSDLRAELVKRSKAMFSEENVDRETVTMEANIALLENTEQYKEFKNIEKISLGDTVHLEHYKLGITTTAQCIGMTYNCLRDRAESVTLGEFQPSFFSETSLTNHKINTAIRNDGSVVAEKIQGVIDAVTTQFKAQNTIAKKQAERAILFEDLDPNSATYGAMSLGTLGWQIANERTEDGRDWKWRTAANANGVYSDAIFGLVIKGVEIEADRGKIGAFVIDNGQIVQQGGLFADYVGPYRAYRTFIQPAYYDKEAGTAGHTWSFSVQAANVENGVIGTYSGKWVVEACGDTYQNATATHNGDIIINNSYSLKTNRVNDYTGKSLIGVINGATVVGVNNQNRDTNIFTTQENAVNICFGTVSSSFTFIKGSSDYQLQVPTNLSLFAGDSDGLIYLGGNCSISGNLKINRINDSSGKNLIGVISGNTVVGLGDQERNTNIYTHPDYVINMIFGTASSYFRFLKGSDNYQIQVPTNLSLFANTGKGNIYLGGSCSTGGNCSVNGNFKTYGDLKLKFRATSGTIPLVVNSSGIITTSSSSRRYKENITEKISEELDYMKVLDIPVCEYNYKPEHKDKELVAGKQIGLIAEDVQKYFPNASILDEEGQAENWQDRIILSALLGVCKQQQQDIDELKERTTILENKTGER